MENLNDAEFGSDKSTEEAPILVAQRYLNIYRQVHIFNKAKRDQFDDELLALPQNVTNFFKRMPGGRLLVEHIEEVKTERGIAFVKTNRDEFNEGSGLGESTPQVVQSGAIAPIVGGSVTVDASFAEALANSMANAFKQNPMQATVSGTGTVNSTIDFGNAFDVIAEEIRTSRASLLDVLKETKSITDSVIASQVSISRILEGILSSRTKDNIGTADLNNRIIASQTSITKLLEVLYSSNTQKNNEISDYLNIENRLQSFKNEMRAEIEQSLGKIQDMFSEYTKTLMSLQSKPVNVVVEREYKNNNEFIEEDIVEDEKFDENYSTENIEATTQQKKKKKKKKKNKNIEQGLNSVEVVGTSSAINGVIRNESFKHNDNFDNVNLDEPPLDFNEEISSTEYNFSQNTLRDDIDDDFDDGLDFVLPEQGSSLKEEDNVELESNNVSLDDLSFEDSAEPNFENENVELESDNVSLDDLSFEDSAEPSFESESVELESDNVSLDDLSFEDSAEPSLESENIELESDNVSLDDLSFEDSAEPSLESENIELESDNVSLDDLSFEDSAEPNFESENVELESDNVSLDDLSFEDSAEPSFESESVELESDNVSLDDLSFEDSAEPSFESENIELESDNVSLDDLSFEDSAEPSFENEDSPLENDYSSLDDLSFEDSTEPSFENEDSPLENDYSSLDDLSFEDSTEPSLESESIELESDNVSLDDLSFEDSAEPSFENEDSPLENDYSSLDNLSLDDNIEGHYENDAMDSESYNISVDEFSAGYMNNEPQEHNTQSRYSAELDKIRAALTSDNIDISSLEEPISLDDYNDNENVKEDEDEEWEYEYVLDEEETPAENLANNINSTETTDNTPTLDEEWEYEYVDENGNPIENSEDGDWEWEYVEEELDENNNDNKE